VEKVSNIAADQMVRNFYILMCYFCAVDENVCSVNVNYLSQSVTDNERGLDCSAKYETRIRKLDDV